MGAKKTRKKGKSWEDALADGSFRKTLRRPAFTPLPIETPAFSAPESGPVVTLVDMPMREADGFMLSSKELYVVFAALTTMIDDVHAVQDQMTDKQWKLAEDLYKRLTAAVEKSGR